MKMKNAFIYVIIGLLVFTPVAGGAALDFCDESHHVDIGADLDLGCCDSTFSETDHCHDTHINSPVFVSPNNIRLSFQLSMAKLFVCNITKFPNLNISKHTHPRNLITKLPDDLSYKSTIVLLI